jgi:general secretion pathway protein G
MNPTNDTLRRRLAEALMARRGIRVRRGMTLMEVMIVIAIILLLMSVLTFGLAGMFGQAQGDAAKLQIQRIDERVRLFKIKKRKTPTDLQEVFKDEPMPIDPWGNEYVLRSSGGGGGKRDYDIMSYGADGKEGGTGNDADIKLSED